MKTPQRTTKKRNPMAMVIASSILLFGLTIIVLACLNFAAFGWGYFALVLLGGLSSAGAGLMTLITGKPEWILLHLMLPG